MLVEAPLSQAGRLGHDTAWFFCQTAAARRAQRRSISTGRSARGYLPSLLGQQLLKLPQMPQAFVLAREVKDIIVINFH